jgi:hypothetical protein
MEPVLLQELLNNFGLQKTVSDVCEATKTAYRAVYRAFP